MAYSHFFIITRSSRSLALAHRAIFAGIGALDSPRNNAPQHHRSSSAYVLNIISPLSSSRSLPLIIVSPLASSRHHHIARSSRFALGVARRGARLLRISSTTMASRAQARVAASRSRHRAGIARIAHLGCIGANINIISINSSRSTSS